MRLEWAELEALSQAGCCIHMNGEALWEVSLRSTLPGKAQRSSRVAAGFLHIPLGRPEGLVVTWGSGIQATPCLHRARESRRHRGLKDRGRRPGTGSPALLVEPYLELRPGRGSFLRVAASPCLSDYGIDFWADL